ncbi:MAG: hypothetical protein ACK6CP_23010, partial [Pseudanabaena sp.]
SVAIALSTNQQRQTAIAPNLITKRSPKISILPPHKRSPLNNQQHQTAIAPNLIQKAIAQNIPTFTHKRSPC